MSTKNATEWLMSHKRFDAQQLKKIPNRTFSVAITSGKGGVGKSTISTNIALGLEKQGYKTGLLDYVILYHLVNPVKINYSYFINSTTNKQFRNSQMSKIKLN